MQDQEIQEQLNRLWTGWKLGQLLGEGSFGKVFRIEREEFGHVYESALKVMTIPQNQSEIDSALSEGMDEGSATTYFYSVVKDIVEEFTLMSRLRGNSTIVSYEDHAVVPIEGTIGWNIFIRMELLSPLMSYFKTKRVTLREILNLGLDICSALEICEQYSIIHRDIKPENIFVSEIGKYKLGDFGIARQMEKTTGNFSRKGTMNYMAPEIFNGNEYDATVDLYSLGIVLYRFLNNNRGPFLPPYPVQLKYSDKEEANAKRMSGAPLPPPANAKGKLAEVILKACAFSPADRFANASQMKAALYEVLREEESRMGGGSPSAGTAGYGASAGGSPSAGAAGYGSPGEGSSAGAAGYGSPREGSSTGAAETGSSGLKLQAQAPAGDETVHLVGSQKERAWNENGAQAGSGYPAAGVSGAQGGKGEERASGAEGKGRRFAVPAAAAGIVLIGALGFGLYQKAARTEVPAFSGMMLEEAVSLAESEEYELKLTSSGEEYSDTVEKGKIISQSLQEGTKIKKGESVTVVVSKGALSQVPALAGKDRDAAKAAVEAAGLAYAETEEYSDTVPAGTVISQQEAEGTKLEPGKTVSVVVSRGSEQPEVPTLSGMTLEEAQAALEKLELTCESSQEYSSQVEQGKVIRQETEPGTKVEKGSTVKVAVSLGPEPVKQAPKQQQTPKQNDSDDEFMFFAS